MKSLNSHARRSPNTAWGRLGVSTRTEIHWPLQGLEPLSAGFPPCQAAWLKGQLGLAISSSPETSPSEPDRRPLKAIPQRCSINHSGVICLSVQCVSDASRTDTAKFPGDWGERAGWD